MKRTLGFFALLVLIAALPASTGVIVSFDAPTLDKLLNAVVAKELQVNLTPDRAIAVRLENLRVLGFEPPSDGRPNGTILTSIKVRAPELGLDVSLRPRVVLDVAQAGERTLIELRFEGLEIPLPFGRFDLGRLLPALSYPADTVFDVAGSNGDVAVRSRLSRVTMDKEQVRFEMELEVAP